MWRCALFLTALAASPAAAEEAAPCRLCDGAPSLIAPDAAAAVPMRLEVETSLDFDTLVLTGPAGGVARLTPDGGRLTSGALANLSARAMVGEVVIRGEPGRTVRVALPDRIELHGWNGATLRIARITSNLSVLPQLDSEGRLRFRFGGELEVSGEAEGDYRGDVAITVEYL